MLVLGLILLVATTLWAVSAVEIWPRAKGDPLFSLSILWPNGEVTRWPR